MNKKISFTGTRDCLTKSQKIILLDEILYMKEHYSELIIVHGDCIGADADIHDMAMSNELIIHKRPCNINSQRAFTEGGLIIAEPENPLDRNKKIVNESDELFACPNGFEEKLRSGTWSTVRYARKKKIPITIIWPDGTINEE